MPDELTVEVFEGDVARELVRAWCEAEAEDAVEQSAIAAVKEKSCEGGERGEGVDCCEAR